MDYYRRDVTVQWNEEAVVVLVPSSFVLTLYFNIKFNSRYAENGWKLPW